MANCWKLLVCFFCFSTFSCVEDQPLPDPEKEKLFQDIQTLRLENLDKDSSLNQILKYFNEIQDNLTEIKKRENLISIASNNSLEMNENKKSQIIDDIQLINSLISKNKSKINELRNLLKVKDLKIEELDKMLQSLNQLIVEKDSEIATLKDQLKELKFSYELLSLENTEKEELIKLQQDEINTAYYCFGTSKELKEKGVVSKEGGFIGIGKSEKLVDNINQEYFTKIDYTKTTKFDVFSKKTKLITTHPESSYEWKMNGKNYEQLVIKDPEKFWSISKYMVIIVE